MVGKCYCGEYLVFIMPFFVKNYLTADMPAQKTCHLPDQSTSNTHTFSLLPEIVFLPKHVGVNRHGNFRFMDI